MQLEFSRQIFEKSSLSNFMKIRSVGAGCSIRAGGWAVGQADMKLIVALRNLANAPKNVTRRYTNFIIANITQLHVSAA